MARDNSSNIQPIFIMPQDTQRTTGKSAQRNNIMAARLVGETVRTTLGPKGMDKMIVDSMGDVIITNDGVTILEEMQIEHPAAKMLVEVAKTQENEVGDGTTSVVVIAGELLKNAETLLDQNIHPTAITKGFQMAEEKAQQILDKISETVNDSDTGILKKIAMTAMTGKGAEVHKDLLANLSVKAVKAITQKKDGKSTIDKSDVKIEKKVGGSVENTELIEGVVVDKEKVHFGMPSLIKNAKIALLDTSVEIKNTEIDAKIQITDPEKLQSFLDMEEGMLRRMVEKIHASNANVVFCQKGIDDLAQHFFSKKGIYAVRRVKKSDMDQLAKATGASIVSNLDDLSSKDLGSAGIVEEVKVNDESMTYVRDCKNPRAVTVLIHGSTDHVVDEVKRAVEDAIGDLIAALKNNKFVAGAGSCEVEVAREIRKFADSFSGREQYAVRAFADSLEIIPKTLAENAGLDPIDVITELKAAHDKGQKWAGINVFTGKVMDAYKEGVLESLKIKTQAISSATEVAVMLLRIDDVIAGSQSSPSGQGMGHGQGMIE